MGYYQGDPEKVRNAKADDVLNIISYENFVSDYEFSTFKLNNPD